MSKYHINKHGVPAPCHAKPGNCPLGGNEQHFNNIEEAQSYVDKANEVEHGLIKKVTKRDIKVDPYMIPKDTKEEQDIDSNLFTEEGHKLIKQDGIWIHIDESDNVVGTMGEPTVVYDDSGNLVSVIDEKDPVGNFTIKTMKSLKIISKLNLSEEGTKSMKYASFFSPEEDIDEYKEAASDEKDNVASRSYEALKRTISLKGANNTSELFASKEDDNEVSAYFRDLETKEDDDRDYEKVEFNPSEGEWDEIPSGKDIPIEVWKSKNLDVRGVGDKWIIIDSKGDIYGSLNNPTIAINLENETIMAVGEEEDIEEACINAEMSLPSLSGGSKSGESLASVRLNSKNNSLEKTKDLFYAIKD